MAEIKKELLKIPSEIKYFASNKQRIADGETFVITEDHTISDILRYLLTVSDKTELIYILENLDG